MRLLSSVFFNSTRVCKLCVPLFLQWNSRSASSTKMAPIPENTSEWVRKTIKNSAIILFSKSYCPYCFGVKQLFKERKIKYATIELDQRVDGPKIQEALQKYSKITTVPQVYVRGEFIGDGSTINKMDEEGKLMDAINKNPYDYDLVVIGGGSGGLAASKEAVKYGAKTAVLDFVKPTPIGTTWGLGGTCVNVGCIPKKLMHQAGIHHQNLEDSVSFGWEVPVKAVKHDWGKMVGAVQDHIHSLNFGYRVVLRDNAVDYLNAYGELIDAHTIKITKKNGESSTITTNTIILAMGERPRYPGIPGDKEYGITSDDLFSLPCPPGRTLCIGASYVSLECAGFLTHLGYDATVMVRSILLRGFDQQMAEIVGAYMEKHGTKFIRGCVPTKIRELEPADRQNGIPGRFEVVGKYTDGTEYRDEFNTVVFAIGRDPCVDKETMAKLGVQLDKAGRVVCTDDDMSTVENIYAIGDINSGKPQLTPVAIQAGRFLARRLYAGETELTDYVNVPTTVFTPLEYGACGLSEEEAIAKYGKENLEVYHSNFNPLEWALPHRDDNICYAKLICNNKDLNEKLRQLRALTEAKDSDTQSRASSSSPLYIHSSFRPRPHSRPRVDLRRSCKPPSDLSALRDRVVGLHVVGPNAGEITQGFAVAIKIGATKDDFDRTIGIHPTCAETFTTLHVTKNSGASAKVTGC